MKLVSIDSADSELHDEISLKYSAVDVVAARLVEGGCR